MERYQFTEEQRALYESLKQPFAIFQFVDKQVVPLLLSDGFCTLMGYTDREQAYYNIGHDMYRGTHPDDLGRIADASLRFVTGGDYDIIYRTRLTKGEDYRIIHAAGKHVWTDDGVRLAHVWYTDEGVYREREDVKEGVLNQVLSSALHENQLLKTAQYDYLTGLPNLGRFFEVAGTRKEEFLSKGSSPVMLYIDFNGMKFFNSKYGFEEGDKMLKSFAGMLEYAFATENCCRIGADHFAVIAEKKGLEEKLDRIFRKMNNGRYPPVHVGLYSDRMEDVHPSVACDRAKLACGTLNGKYQSAYAYYDQSVRNNAMRRQYIVENIDRAVREKWIQVYYQPIIRAVNGKICDEEALARWMDPVRGMLSPAEFIPALEDSGLIYKLDLCVLEQVLEKMKLQALSGQYLVPQSINLSRADFDGCDIVEEIRRRVDDAGIGRSFVTIEITESVIGSDFDFMKAQVERFQALGFPVWMDDFGSGYSSLHMLQSIKFDLLKFDMSFMRRLDEGNGGKVILSELMHMATALGVDTVCEGVETLDQVYFLKEIGCSKLQGFYFSQPIPSQEVLKLCQTGSKSGYENPEESLYYETIGRVNLYDLAVLANAEEDAFQKTFSTLPMGIIEVKDDTSRFIRSNQSYRDFIKRFFSFDLSHQDASQFEKFKDPFMYNVVKNCCEHGTRSFFDEKMPDGSVVHSFARRIGINPVSGNIAVAVAVLSITDPNENTTYGEIARALAADYYNICVVDLDTDQYMEYSSSVGSQEMVVERHGDHFFDASEQSFRRVYEEDRESFQDTFTKDNIVKALDSQGAFTFTYRVVDPEKPEPVYVNMKITRMPGRRNHIIIGINVVDGQMKQKAHLEALQRERNTLMRVMALSDGFLSLYTVDVETSSYVEFNSTEIYDSLGITRSGDRFFEESFSNAEKVLYPQDIPLFQREFTRENVLRQVHSHGSFKLQYRLMMDGRPQNVMLKVSPFLDGGKEKLMVGVREWKERKTE